MGTLKELLKIATDEIGVEESPPNSNRVKYNTWYYGREVSGPDYPWCMVFCQWVYNKAGVKLPVCTASCTTMLNEAKRVKRYYSGYHLKPGDLVLFDFKRTGINAQHCGIVESVNGTKITAIEGNTSTTNQTNGGCVMRRGRTANQVIGAFRPIFDGEEVEIDMTIADFVNKLSEKEAYTLLTKAMAYADKQPQPQWSRNEGYWDKARKKKVVTSDTPEGIVKRDELIAILGRLDIL